MQPGFSHISTILGPGNEEADALAQWSSYLGQTKGTARIITEGGIRAEGKQRRAALRHQQGFRRGGAVMWKRQALSAYTWMRTNKGPQKQWLHFIRKADSPFCQCDDREPQTGDHLTSHCPLHAQTRRALIPGKRSWEDLDHIHWIKTGPDERVDGVELFFIYMFHQLTT